MALITNSQVIAFSNERLRTSAELIQKVKVQFEGHKAVWDGGVSSLINNVVDDTIEDGRELEGIFKLTGADAYLMMTRIDSLLAVLQAPFAMDVVNKVAVRVLQVN